jgi:hypothetical protein
LGVLNLKMQGGLGVWLRGGRGNLYHLDAEEGPEHVSRVVVEDKEADWECAKDS